MKTRRLRRWLNKLRQGIFRRRPTPQRVPPGRPRVARYYNDQIRADPQRWSER